MKRVFFIRSFLWIVAAMLVAIAVGNSPPSEKRIGRVIPPQVSPPRDRGSLDEIYLSTDVPKFIPDGPGGVALCTLWVPVDLVIRDVKVLVSITHNWMRDLRISLISPDSIEVLLLDLFPGDSAVNMTDCWFDDNAALSIYEAPPPFTGSFRPLSVLDTLNGHSSFGKWTLRVEDRFPVDTGFVTAWGMDVNPAVCLQGRVRNVSNGRAIANAQVYLVESGQRTYTDTSGNYSFTSLTPDTYTVRFVKADSLNIKTKSSPVRIPDATETLPGEARMSLSVGLFDTLFISDVVIISGQPTTQDTSLQPRRLIISDVDVTVNITHTYVGDLRIFLIGPSGSQIQLVDSNSVDSLNNIRGCRFSDEASRPFTSGTAPFTGSWRPLDTLSAFDGQSAQGNWQLYVTDNFPGDYGQVDSFTVHLDTTAAEAVEQPSMTANSFAFEGNFPNPFNSRTTFTFRLAKAARTELVLYDILGQEVARLWDGYLSEGEHSIPFDGSSLSSGLYFARLKSGSLSQTRKVLLLR